jgi:hypothetical protein
MLFSQDRSQLRGFFYEAWRKHTAGEPLEPMETIVAAVVAEHPEYHALLADPDAGLDRDYTPEGGESNPFLHMGMHIALREQLTSQRPAGIVDAHEALAARLGDGHEADYLDCVRRL